MILYINSCIRKSSRTEILANEVLKILNDEVKEVKLKDENLVSLNEELINLRDEASKSLDFSNPYFRYAKDFKDADTIVISAPFYDLSFPSILKTYIESICITGLTFKYSETGIPIGLCKAKKLYFIQTSGGAIINHEYGYGYIEDLAKNMFSIKETYFVTAEGLDIVGNNEKEILENAIKNLDNII